MRGRARLISLTIGLGHRSLTFKLGELFVYGTWYGLDLALILIGLGAVGAITKVIGESDTAVEFSLIGPKALTRTASESFGGGDMDLLQVLIIGRGRMSGPGNYRLGLIGKCLKAVDDGFSGVWQKPKALLHSFGRCCCAR
jgi:hypothetical protein